MITIDGVRTEIVSSRDVYSGPSGQSKYVLICSVPSRLAGIMMVVENYSHERTVRMKLFTRGTALTLVAGALWAGASTGLSAAEPRTTRDAHKIAATSKSHVNPARNPARQTITDVSLAQGGVLRGVLVDEQGRPLVKSAVIIRQGRRVFSRTDTGLKGEFQFKGLRGGVYEVASVNGHGAFRVWAPGTAPKAARRQALIVSRSQVVRGQFADLGLSTLTNLGDLGALGGMGTASGLATAAAVAGITVGAVVVADEANNDDPPPAATGTVVTTP